MEEVEQEDAQEDLEKLDRTLYRSIIQSLDEDNRWRSFIRAMSEMGFSRFLSFETLKKQRSPSSLLMEELTLRLCTVENFKAILRQSDLLETLSLISDPESLEIVKQPCGELGCAQHDALDEQCKHIAWGDALVLECRAVGIPRPHYQWFRENVLLEGCNSAFLRVAGFKTENEGDYYCVVTQKVGDDEYKIISNYVVCKLMHSLPEFLDTKPSLYRVEVDTGLSLSVELKCTSPYNLQWYKNSTLLEGETTKTYIKDKVCFEDAGKYRCLAFNEAGEVWSTSTEVEVEKIPLPTRKLALLIGNSNYEKFDNLSTPCNDIILLAERFKKLDFQVISLVNLTSKEMKSAIDFFFELTSQDSYVVICFIGHGFKYCARNYMMPVDCADFDEGLEALDLSVCDELLVQKAHTKEVSLLLLIVDMCLEEVMAECAPLKDQKNHYLYEPYSKCHVIRLYSTGPHQRAYEVSGQVNGCYIRYLSGYIFEDEPLIRLAVKVNEKFWQSGMANYQSPHFTILGGQAMKLTTPPRDCGITINEFHTTKVYTVNFPKVGFSGVLFEVTFHGEHISNAIDIRYPKLPSGCILTCQTSHEEFICCTDESALGVTIYNLQKAKSHIPVNLHLKALSCDGTCHEDTAVITLAFPFIAKLMNTFTRRFLIPT